MFDDDIFLFYDCFTWAIVAVTNHIGSSTSQVVLGIYISLYDGLVAGGHMRINVLLDVCLACHCPI